MTGERAQQYARSRHSTSDFDRSLRQQQVIEAIKRKIFEADYLTSPKKIKEFYDIYKTYVATDIGISDILDFYPVLKNLDELKMLSYNVNDSCFY
jgi:anionic cell wall polymer biosynthesis LytR-Cps2A-Psr (LCP) family protein